MDGQITVNSLVTATTLATSSSARTDEEPQTGKSRVVERTQLALSVANILQC